MDDNDDNDVDDAVIDVRQLSTGLLLDTTLLNPLALLFPVMGLSSTTTAC